MKLPKRIILASAKYVNADLLSDDWDDFQNIDSTVVVKNLDDLKSSQSSIGRSALAYLAEARIIRFGNFK